MKFYKAKLNTAVFLLGIYFVAAGAGLFFEDTATDGTILGLPTSYISGGLMILFGFVVWAEFRYAMRKPIKPNKEK